MVEIQGSPTPLITPARPVGPPPAKADSSPPPVIVTNPEINEIPAQDTFAEQTPIPLQNTTPTLTAEPAVLPLQTVRKLETPNTLGRTAGSSMRAEILQKALQQSLDTGIASPGLALSLAIEAQGLVSAMRSETAAPPAPLPSAASVQEKLASLSDGKAPRLFESLEQAIEAANQNNSGNEALVEVITEDGQKQYALVELKASTTPAQVREALATPGKLYTTNSNGVLQSTPIANENNQARFSRVKELADVALSDKARGFDLNRAGTQEADRTPAYLANISTTLTEIGEAQTALQSEKSQLDGQLKTLNQTGQGTSPAAQEIRSRLQELGGQLSQLDTARTILDARLSQLAPAQAFIPGTERKVGSDRAHPEQIQARLQTALDLVETHLASATSPDERSQLETQKEQLTAEIAGVSKRNLQIQEAGLNTRIRLGSLATIHKDLSDAHSHLEGDLQKLATLEARMPTLKGSELESTSAEISRLRSKIETGRKDLIKKMEAQIGVYKEHANTRQKGAQDAISLLELQVAKLKAADGKSPDALLATIAETQKVLLDSVKQAGDKFVGITPDEAKALSGIAGKTDAYIADYRKALSQLSDLKADISRKSALMTTPPVSAIGNKQLGALDQAYVARVQAKLKDAPEGSKLEQLKKLYVALEMSKSDQVDPDLRARIDTAEIERQITALGQDPEVQKAFDEARQEAIKDVFGDKDPSTEVAELLLSDGFAEYLSLLPEEEQSQVLTTEITKLMALNPAKAKEVQATLVARQLQSRSGDILKGLSLEERKAAFEQVFGLINPGNAAADKGSKAADAMSQAIGALSPAEMQKMREYMTLIGRNDPKASEKLYLLLAGKLEGMGPKGVGALGHLNDLRGSGKLGAFMTIVAGVATTGKVPDALKKGDFKSITDLTSSALSVAGGTPGVLKMFGVSVDKGLKVAEAMFEAGDMAGGLAKASRMATAAKVLKVMEVLGPIGDTLGAGLDAYGSYQDFQNGDTVGGYAKATGAGAGAVGAIAGVAILAGATGPGAPLVLAGATVVGLVAWGIDAAWGESEEETFLRQLGVLKPEAPQPTPRVLTPAFDGDPGLSHGSREML
jgi:hypothetical protein